MLPETYPGKMNAYDLNIPTSAPYPLLSYSWVRPETLLLVR